MRLPKASDLSAVEAFRTSERSKGVGGPYAPGASFHYMSAVIGPWQLRGYGRWIVADKDTDVPLGLVGIYHPEDWPEAEIGWSIYDANSEGKGIAFEAAIASRDFAYNTLGWDRIVSLVMPDNTRSIALAERMGCEKTDRFDHPTYGALDIWVHAAAEAMI
jgi:ribosomal-protein-alanine N-acetyltransferase